MRLNDVLEKNHYMKSFIQIVGMGAVVFLLGACGSVNVDDVLPDKSVEYKREKQAERNLEVPPDLTTRRINDKMSVPDNFAGVATNYSEYVTDRRLRGVEGGARTTGGVLPENPKIKEMRDGDARWLVVDAPADAVWDKVLEFWQDQGILLEEQDPELGIMRTSWLENRANISRDVITNAVRKVFDGLYETSLRDQYRVRFERVGNGRTEIYLTHYGMEEKLVADSTGDVENTVWEPRPRDPNLEAVMLRRLKVYLGAADERAQARQVAKTGREKPRSQLVQTADGVRLRIDDGFPRSWRLVGLALDRVGFAVEDRDRSAGVYYVRYNDPTTGDKDAGFFSKLKFWGDDAPERNTQYQIKVAQGQDVTEVVVQDDAGQMDRTPTAARILKLIQEQIR